MAHRAAPLAALAVGAAACAPGTEAAADNAALPAIADSAPADPVLAGTISGFETPESVQYDPELDVYYVSNIAGSPSAKDENGFITRVHADSLGFPMMRWVASGRNGVTLSAPKGMAITGDTLWVADVDAVRGFSRRTGNPLATVDLAPLGAVFLNDLAVGPDGALYVTDTGIRFEAGGQMSAPGPFRIFRIAGGTPTVAAEGDTLARPNGIARDTANDRFLLAPFGGPAVMTWTPGAPPEPYASGPGSYDGLVVLDDGRALVSSWADSSVYAIPPGGGSLRRLVAGVASPADIGWNPARRLVAIPLFADNRVVFYEIAP